MATCWDILGIASKDATVKDVKRAYAAKLKTTRPEDHPQGFMALRQAFEQALNITKSRENVAKERPPKREQHEGPSKDMDDGPDPFGSFCQVNLNTSLDPEPSGPPASPEPDEPDFLETRVAKIIERLSGKTDENSKASLIALLEDDGLDDLTVFMQLEDRLRQHLAEKTGYFEGGDPHRADSIKREDVILLCDRFGWWNRRGDQDYAGYQIRWISKAYKLQNLSGDQAPQGFTKPRLKQPKPAQTSDFNIWNLIWIVAVVFAIGRCVAGEMNQPKYYHPSTGTYGTRDDIIRSWSDTQRDILAGQAIPWDETKPFADLSNHEWNLLSPSIRNIAVRLLTDPAYRLPEDLRLALERESRQFETRDPLSEDLKQRKALVDLILRNDSERNPQ